MALVDLGLCWHRDLLVVEELRQAGLEHLDQVALLLDAVGVVLLGHRQGEWHRDAGHEYRTLFV